MLRFALKSMLIKKARMLLVTLSIVLSASVALISYNVSMQVNEGIVSTAGYYDLIVGPAGSATQLAMNTMFFTDEPLGTIPYEYVHKIEESGLANQVVPFTMGDSFNSARIVGTTSAYLDGKTLKSGEMFENAFEAVVGNAVAQRYSLSVGDTLVTSHGLTGAGHAHESSPLTVTGILQKTSTAFDNVIFTSVETVWSVHGTHGMNGEDKTEHEHPTDGSSQSAAPTGALSHDSVRNKLQTGHSESVQAETDDHDHEAVCAILVKSKSFNDYYKLTELFSDNSALLLINPATVLREVMESVDLSTEIVYVLCGVILLMNIVVISVITLLNMYDAQKDIALMRLIGVSMKKIGLVYLIENGIIGLVSVVLALVIGHAALGIMSGYVASMGIVLSSMRVYPAEMLILFVVLLLSILPTMLRIRAMAKKDSALG